MISKKNNALLRESAVYALYSRAADFIILLWNAIFESVCYRAVNSFISLIVYYTKRSKTYYLLSLSTKIDVYTKNSVILKLFDGITVGVLSIFEKIYKCIRSFNAGSINNVTFKKIEQTQKFNFEHIFGYAFVLVFIVPHNLWNNIYGLGIAFGLLFVYMLAILSGRSFQYRLSGINIGIIVFMFMSASAVVLSYAPRDSLRVFLFFITAYIFMFMASGAHSDEKSLNRFLGFVYLTLMITSVICIGQEIIGVEADAVLSDMVTNEGMPGRAYSTLENPNNYAEFIVMFFPFCWAYALNSDKHKGLLLAGLILPVAAIGCTYSRSCWVSLMIGVLVFIVFYDIKYLPILILGALFCIPFLPRSIINRILTIGSMEDTSNAYRVYIWSGTVNMLKDFWTRGIGLGAEAFRKIYPPYSDPWSRLAPHSHMLPLQVFAEMGIIGFLSFVFFYVSQIKKCITAYINDRITKEMKTVIIACLSSFSGLIFVSMVEYIWFYPRVMLAFFTVLGITAAALRIVKIQSKH